MEYQITEKFLDAFQARLQQEERAAGTAEKSCGTYEPLTCGWRAGAAGPTELEKGRGPEKMTLPPSGQIWLFNRTPRGTRAERQRT